MPAVLGLLIALGSAEAGPSRRSGKAAAAKAKEHNEAGLAAYKTQDYDGAISEWKTAYRLDPDPGTLFAIGQAQRLAGDCQAALETYQEVLQSYISSKQGKEVRKVIEICEKQVGVGTGKKSKPAKPEKAIKPEKPERTEEPEEAEKPAARSGFRASATTRVEPPAEKRVEEDEDKDDEKAAPIEERAEKKQSARKEPEPERSGGTPWYRDTLGTVLVGAGVVGLATGTTFLVLARGHEASAREAVGYDPFSQHLSVADRDRKISVVGFVAGSALVVGGVIRYMTRSSGAKREGVEVTGWVTPSGGAIGLGGAF